MPKKNVPRDAKSDGDGAPFPTDFDAQARSKFNESKNPELSFEQFLEHELAIFLQQEALRTNPALAYQPSLSPTMTACGNGDLETSLDLTQWQGAYGALSAGGGSPGNLIVGSLTAGILSGPSSPNDAIDFLTGPTSNFATQAHQRWVAAGSDWNLLQCIPSVNLPKTAPGSLGAVRIGNMVTGGGCELLSKTFVVGPSQVLLTYWYAVVFQSPDDGIHAPLEKPYFRVRVTDQAGNIVPNASNLGSGGDMLLTDPNNPFFGQTSDWLPVNVGHTVVYKKWAAAQINLSSMLNQQVTIEFLAADCWHTGHYGYAYIDSLCGDSRGSPEGSLSFNLDSSSKCGLGQLCFDYTLPTAFIVSPTRGGVTVTGSVQITLNIYQNGALLTSFVSPLLTAGSAYCFPIDPATIPGLNSSLGGVDFAATAAFTIPGLNGSLVNLLPISVGTAPHGVNPGPNNDYLIVCEKSCADIVAEQNENLSKQCSLKVNELLQVDCQDPKAAPVKVICNCECMPLEMPEIKPCISVAWGESDCDCVETDDVEIFCITVCNCYSNVTFGDFSIGQIQVTDANGNPVPLLPDGTPSVRVIPSGPICFGDVEPCQPGGRSCVSRQLALWTRGAVGGDYKLSFKGVCFSVCSHHQIVECFRLTLCKD